LFGQLKSHLIYKMAYKLKRKKLKMPKWTKSERDYYDLGYWDSSVGNTRKRYKFK